MDDKVKFIKMRIKRGLHDADLPTDMEISVRHVPSRNNYSITIESSLRDIEDVVHFFEEAKIPPMELHPVSPNQGTLF